jgi:hypothetical protein
MWSLIWDNSPIKWLLKQMVGVQPKMAPKEAAPSWYVPPPGIRKGMISNTYNPPLPQPTTFNTSSNFIKPNPIGKPLVIQNWDRLIGMIFPISISNNQYGNWIVVQAGQTTDGYECVFENGGGFGTSNRAVTFNVYGDMYDSHRAMVKCGGRMSTMPVDFFKDPNRMLYAISQEFSEKFR